MERTRAHLLVAFAAILIAGGGSAPACAEEVGLSSPSLDFPNSLGVFGSSMNGGGLSYQRWVGELGFAAAAGGFALPASGMQFGGVASTTDVMNYGYNIEADLMYRLFASNFWNWLSGDLLVYASATYKGAKTADYVYNPDKDDATEDSYYREGKLEQAVAAGLGIGYEIVLFRHFSIPLQFGYQAEWPFKVDFCFSGGLRYRYR